MNVNQFYYTNKVLGISSFIRPKHLRFAYSLNTTHYSYTSASSTQKKTILYFAESLNIEGKTIIQKINQALKQPDYILIEIKNIKPTPSLFKNLLTRFSPQGFVIFGSQLAEHLIIKNKTLGKIRYCCADKYIDGCILSTVKNYQGNSEDVQKRKQEGWSHLKSLAE